MKRTKGNSENIFSKQRKSNKAANRRVSDDTLEFINLDDLLEAEEDYNSENYEDEVYEEEYYDSEEYEEEYYDSEYYDEEDYEDEYYEIGKDNPRNVFIRVGRFAANMSALDRIVAVLGIFILIAGMVTGGIYVNAQTTSDQVEAFAQVGTEMDGISVVGESGLIAMADAEALKLMMGEDEEAEEEEEQQEGSIEVELNLTSIQSDIKIKFVGKSTGRLISGVPFEVEVKGTKGKKFELKDDDKDGIIYQTGVDADTYTVTALALQGDEWKDYILPSSASTIKVTDTIAYKKVDVSDEIKKESEINAAVEDTAVQNTEVESVLTDTVEWVESTKTPVGSDENYSEIKKDQIPDPSTTGALSAGFLKMVKADGSVCECIEKCTGSENENQGCPVCQNGNWGNCQYANSGSKTTQSEEEAETSPTEYAIEITNCPETLTVGSTAQASAKTTPSGGKITWSSSEPDIVAIEETTGKMVAKAEGTATIAAAYGSLIVTATVKVEASKEGTSKEETSKEETADYSAIVLSGTNSLKVNETGTVSGKTTPEGGKISWTSSDRKIVQIEKSDASSATFKGIAAGTATITAECGDASETWKVTVTETREQDLSKDNKSKLKDKNGNQVYIKKDGKYVEAVYADYYTADKFYLRKEMYIYTGWQTIDGYTYFFDKNGNYVTGEQVIQGAKYTFGSDGRLSSGSGTLGIDVSKWNGNIDWNAVRNSGISYVIIRCGYRGSSTGVLVEDPKFASNIKGAKAAGLRVGVYFFSQAVSEAEAVEEASMALKLVSGYGLNLPIFLDVEGSGGRGDKIDVGTRTAVCKAFCQTVQNSGYTAGIYANKTWLTSYINTGSLTSYKIWLAQYAASPSYTKTRYDMWQYSSKGSVSGISGNVDMNISYF